MPTPTPPATPTDSIPPANQTAPLPSSAEPVDGVPFLSGPQGPDELGRLGHYIVRKELGRGGMGVVFLAEDSRLLRPVALKALLPEAIKDAKARDRFLREARAAARIRHDNVVTIFQVEDHGSVPFLAMELLRGMSLEQRLQQGGIPLAEALRIGRETALGLQAAHREGLIHRDIKPANLWLEAPSGRVKILDFGLARPQEEPTKLTRPGTVLGTPNYMSPEQARGKAIDQRSDLFSLGVVLYEMCAGVQPFDGPSVMAVLTALAVETPAPVRARNPHVPAAVESVIHRLLEKDPARRYQNCAELLADLDAAALPARATPVSTPSWSIEPKRTEQISGAHVSAPRGATQALEGPSKRRWLLPLAVAVALMSATLLILFVVVPRLTKEPIKEEGAGADTKKEKDAGKPGPKEITNSIGMRLVRIEPGRFFMGSPATERFRGGAEILHEVEISKPFYLGKFEVTQEQYEAVTGENPSAYSATGAKRDKIAGKDTRPFPVESVTWEEAKEFCKKLSQKEGKEYRLPTEAEWEYACRAGTRTAYSVGHTITSAEANVDFKYGGPLPVGSFAPNAWGIHDMHGNVREWCEDWFEEFYYKKSPPRDPTGPLEGTTRVMRGASWCNGLDGCRSAFRFDYPPGNRSEDFSFRVVLPAP
ncbi:MAG: bifunctional serine/threonine-protein kinase/formylglycine-generating enzyme family protein [Gemmataceae bacterium]